MIRRALLALLILAAIGSLVPLDAHAATRSITMAPPSTALTLLTGVAANRAVTIVNDGDDPYKVTLSVQPYSIRTEEYQPVFSQLPGTTSPTAWVKLQQTSLTLPGHQSASVDYTVTAPAKTQPGGYYAVIFAETEGTNSQGVVTHNRVGNILYITVDGQVKQDGSVKAADLPSFVFGQKVNLGMRVTNSGGTHFQSDTKFSVTTPSGKTQLEADHTYYVLPQTTRLVTQEFSPGGIGGFYTVHRSATVNGTLVALPDATITIIKPQAIALLVFMLLTVIGVVVVILNKRRIKKSQQ